MHTLIPCITSLLWTSCTACHGGGVHASLQGASAAQKPLRRARRCDVYAESSVSAHLCILYMQAMMADVKARVQAAIAAREAAVKGAAVPAPVPTPVSGRQKVLSASRHRSFDSSSTVAKPQSLCTEPMCAPIWWWPCQGDGYITLASAAAVQHWLPSEERAHTTQVSRTVPGGVAGKDRWSVPQG